MHELTITVRVPLPKQPTLATLERAIFLSGPLIPASATLGGGSIIEPVLIRLYPGRSCRWSNRLATD